MKSIIRKLNTKKWIVVLLTTVFSQGANAIDRIVPETDLIYLGAFRIPSTWPTSGSMGSALTFRPNGNNGQGSLFVAQSVIARPDYCKIGEMTIPTPIISKNYNSLNQGQEIQAPVCIASTFGTPLVDTYSGYLYRPKQANQSTDKIYWSTYYFYGTDTTDQPSLGWSDSTLSSPNSVGLFHIGNSGVKHKNRVGDYNIEADHSWSDTYTGGRYILTGRFRGGGQGGSQGPTLYAVAPWQVGNPPTPNANLPDVTLLEYESDFPYPEASRPASEWRNGVWIKAGSKQALLFAGRRATTTCYGTGAECNNPCYGAKGYHGQPFDHLMSWYDINDLTKVAQGQLAATRVLPYSEWIPDNSVVWQVDNICTMGFGGVAYDESNSKLYVAELSAYTGDVAVIHVFRVQNTGINSVEPPKNLTIIKNEG